MVPGHTDAEKASVTVPVLLAFGDHDLTDDFEGNAARYRSSKDVTLFVLPGSAHCHNQAGTRVLLWARVAAWIAALAGLSPDDAPYSAAVSEDVAPVDVEHAVLLVMDYQPGILERVEDPDALAAKATHPRSTPCAGPARLGGLRAGRLRRRRLRRAAHDEQDVRCDRGRAEPASRSRPRPQSTAVAPAAGDIIVRKTRVGAFSTTDLDHSSAAAASTRSSSPVSARAGSSSRPSATPPTATTGLRARGRQRRPRPWVHGVLMDSSSRARPT